MDLSYGLLVELYNWPCIENKTMDYQYNPRRKYRNSAGFACFLDVKKVLFEMWWVQRNKVHKNFKLLNVDQINSIATFISISQQNWQKLIKIC